MFEIKISTNESKNWLLYINTYVESLCKMIYIAITPLLYRSEKMVNEMVKFKDVNCMQIPKTSSNFQEDLP